MKIVASLLLLCSLFIMGCDHSTNNLTPPPGSELAILNPADNAVLDGVVPISVDASAIDKVTKVEFYIDGQLSNARTSPPWSFDWNTTTLGSNTFHTIQARAYALSSSYSVSQAVTVRIK